MEIFFILKCALFLNETLESGFFLIPQITFYLIPAKALHNSFLISSIKEQREFRHAAEKDAKYYHYFSQLQVIHSNPLMKAPHNCLKGELTVDIKVAYVISLWVDVISFYRKVFSNERICQM